MRLFALHNNWATGPLPPTLGSPDGNAGTCLLSRKCKHCKHIGAALDLIPIFWEIAALGAREDLEVTRYHVTFWKEPANGNGSCRPPFMPAGRPQAHRPADRCRRCSSSSPTGSPSSAKSWASMVWSASCSPRPKSWPHFEKTAEYAEIQQMLARLRERRRRGRRPGADAGDHRPPAEEPARVAPGRSPRPQDQHEPALHQQAAAGDRRRVGDRRNRTWRRASRRPLHDISSRHGPARRPPSNKKGLRSGPVSRVLFARRPYGTGARTAISLGRRLLGASSSLPGRRIGPDRPARRSRAETQRGRSAWPCSGWGLPSQPGRPGCWCALTAPFHPYRGSSATGAQRAAAVCFLLHFPEPCGRSALPTTLSCGARTFLSRALPKACPASGRPARSETT